MKKIILFLVAAVLSALQLMAGINTMNYQAVINDTDGKPAAGRTIGMRFAIVSGQTTLMSEETVLTSDAAGMVQYQIGSSLENGLSGIDWTADDIMLQVGIDLTGGTDYTSVYSSSIQSVPTAMYAERSGDSDALREMIDRVDYDIAVLEGVVAQLREESVTKPELEDVKALLDATIASLDAAIVNLNGIVNNVENKVMEHAAHIEALDAQVEENRYRIDETRGRLDEQITAVRVELSNQIDELRAMIESLSNK